MYRTRETVGEILRSRREKMNKNKNFHRKFSVRILQTYYNSISPIQDLLSLISRFSFSIAEDQGETRSREIGLWPATAEKTMTTRADDPLERVTFAQRSADQRLRRFLLEYAPLFDLRSMHTNARRIRARVTYDLRRRNETKKQLRRIDRVLSL